MARLLNPNLFFIIIFFILLRFLDTDLVFKGVLFIFISCLLIYTNQKKLSKKLFILVSIYLAFFTLFNEKKNVTEISSILKITSNTDIFYQNLLEQEKYLLIKDKYLINNKNCINNIKNCFQNPNFQANINTSPDQLFFQNK